MLLFNAGLIDYRTVARLAFLRESTMSFTLLDLGAENFEFTANVWNWKAALEIIRSFDLISENHVRQLGYNAMGTKMSADEAHMIGEKIRN